MFRFIKLLLLCDIEADTQFQPEESMAVSGHDGFF